MARTTRTLLGIEIQEKHYRFIEVSHSGAAPVILSVGEGAMPPGGVENGLVVRPDAVAIAIKRSLNLANVTATSAVFGVPGMSCVVRTLTVPPAQGAELTQIVDGEVRHFGFFHSVDAGYDFCPMPSARGGDVGNSLSVLMMGAEGRAISGIKDIAGRLALEVEAVEPIHIGMYRAASEKLAADPNLMVLTVSERRAHVAMHTNGELCVYRELEMGYETLLVPRSGDDPFLDPQLIGDDTGQEVNLDPSRVQKATADLLAIELRRSIEYYKREYPNFTVEKLILVSPELRLNDLLGWLRVQVGLGIGRVVSFASPADKEATRATLLMPGSEPYAGAYGLAMRGALASKPSVPKLDLYVHERSAEQMEVQRRGATGSLLVAIGFVVAGLIAAYIIGVRANSVEHDLFHLNERVAQARAEVKKNSDRDFRLRKQYDLLRQDGVPVGAIIDAVASEVPQNIGLTDIQTDISGKVQIGGEAIDEGSVIKMADALKSEPLFLTSNVSSFEKLAPESNKIGMKFKINVVGKFGKPPTPPPGTGGSK